MNLRDRRGAITPAEGCMFTAVGLFVILLLVMLYLAFLRFGDRPRSTPGAAPVGMVTHPLQGQLRWAPLNGTVCPGMCDVGVAAHA